MALLSFSPLVNLIVPTEICGLIVEFTQPSSKGHLSNLCRVSRAFRAEGQLHLYGEITLCGVRAAKSWARAVHKRPLLSSKTKQVILHLPRQTGLEADDLGWVVKGLKTCLGLEDLRIFEELDNHSPDGKRDNYGNSVHRWIIEDQPFKLKSFTNQYFQNHLLDKFLISQPDIQSLVLRGDDEFVFGSELDVPLANVRLLDGTTNSVLRFLNSSDSSERHLQHLQVDFRQWSLANIRLWSLLPICETLQSLSIIQTGDDIWGHDFHSFPVMVCEQVPNIRYLRVLSTKISLGGSSLSWEYMIPTAFRRLEVLVLQPPSMEVDDEEQEFAYECAYEAFRLPSARRDAARSAMDAMSSLKRLDFGVGSELHRFLKSENGIDESQVPMEEGYDRHDFDWRQIHTGLKRLLV